MQSRTLDVRCVLFDAVGTLIYPEPPVAAAYGAVARKFGSSRSELEIGERFRQAFCRQEDLDGQASGYRTDEDRERRRWQAIVAEVFDELADPSPAFSELWEHFSQPRHWQLFDDVADAWRGLAAQGVLPGVASNFDRRLRQVCAGLPPLDECNLIFVSSELGVRKPSSDFFRRIENVLRLSAGQIMLIGDDWENDYLAARSAGWQAVFVDRKGLQPAAPDRVRSLAELST